MKKIRIKNMPRRIGTAALSLGLLLAPVGTAWNPLAIGYAAQSAVIRGTSVNVRSSASTSASLVTSLGNNTAVTILGQTTGSDGKIWYQISAGSVSGYVRSDLVSTQSVSYTTDASFEAYLTQQGFPESYKPGLRALHAQYPNWVFQAYQTGLDWSTAVASELQGTSSLVESSAKSSWKSTEDGKFNWTTSTWPGFDGATWVGASQEIVAYFMDPRNFLDDSYIFQFAVHSYDANLQTLEGLQSMLKGTFLEGSVAIDSSSPLYTAAAAAQSIAYPAVADTAGTAAGTTAGTTTVTTQSGSEALISYDGPGAGSTTSAASNVVEGTDSITMVDGGPGTGTTGTTTTAVAQSTGTQTVTVSYAEILMEAAQQSQVSPYMLAAMILQEQGSQGTSGSISGATGYYNYFNVGAYAANGMTAVERGLWYASQSGSYNRPWNTPERAIVGGALFYAENYLASGQSTLYLKRFNVQGSNMFKHQYMTNVEGAASEGKNLGSAYTASMRAGAQVFSIPVYSNMPETASPMPTKDGNPNNKLQSLSVDGFTLTPSFSLDTTSYTLVVDPSVTAVNVSAAAYHSAATISGTGTVLLDEAMKTVTITVTAENGDQRNYQITISKAAGGQIGTGQRLNAAAQTDTSQLSGSVQTSVSADAQAVIVGAAPTAVNALTGQAAAVSSGPS